ncbi:MAG: hypothetical protein KatS3mg077_0095 [Candidatus Binatia bacterium]|nr:MAG: hypothetical protein KatS3mg077_0095 [Candidatus Binatia bacterium]
MMPIDLTAQLVPIFWGAVLLLAVSAMGIGLSGARGRRAIGLSRGMFEMRILAADGHHLYIRL